MSNLLCLNAHRRLYMRGKSVLGVCDSGGANPLVILMAMSESLHPGNVLYAIIQKIFIFICKIGYHKRKARCLIKFFFLTNQTNLNVPFKNNI